MRTSQYSASVYNKQHHQTTYKQFTTKSKRGSKEVEIPDASFSSSPSPKSSPTSSSPSKSASAINLTLKKELSSPENGKISPGLSIFLSKAASVSNLATPTHPPNPNPPSFNTPTHPQPLKFKRASLQITPNQLSQLHSDTSTFKPFSTTRSSSQFFHTTTKGTTTNDHTPSPTLPKSPHTTQSTTPTQLSTTSTSTTTPIQSSTPPTQSTETLTAAPLSPKPPPRLSRNNPSNSPTSPPNSPPTSPRVSFAPVDKVVTIPTSSSPPTSFSLDPEEPSNPHSATSASPNSSPPTSSASPNTSVSSTPHTTTSTSSAPSNSFNTATPSTPASAAAFRNPKTSFLNNRTISSPDLNPPSRSASAFISTSPPSSSDPTSKPASNRWSSTSFRLPATVAPTTSVSSRVLSGSSATGWTTTTPSSANIASPPTSPREAPTSPRESSAPLSPRQTPILISPRETPASNPTPTSPRESTSPRIASTPALTPLTTPTLTATNAPASTPTLNLSQAKQAVLIRPTRPPPQSPKLASTPTTTQTTSQTIPNPTTTPTPQTTPEPSTTLPTTSEGQQTAPRPLSAQEELMQLITANELLRKTNNIIQTTNELLHTAPEPPSTDAGADTDSNTNGEINESDPCEKIHPFFEESPVTVKYAPNQGRFMVAKKFIPAGSIVLQNEVPHAAAIMYSNRKEVCNTCQTRVSEAKRHNMKCCAACEQVYYCSFDCKSSHRPDIPLECSVLRRLRDPLHTPCDDDDILIVKLLIRIICARNNPNADPQRFEDFMLLADHIQDYNEEKWDEMKTLWDLVCELEGEENRGVFSEPKDEIMAILSKIRSNFFGMWSMNGREAVWTGASLYVRCSFFNHSCYPNCLVDQEAKSSMQDLDRNSVGAVVTVRSVCDIQPGEELCLSYIPLDLNTERRRAYLNTNWMFTCQCIRCLDPEADSKPISAYCCPDRTCAGGLLVPDINDPNMGRCRICCSIVEMPPGRSLLFKSAPSTTSSGSA